MLEDAEGGEAVGMPFDQVPGAGEGVWPLLRPHQTLAARLAATGATVVLAYAERLPQGRGYHLHLFPCRRFSPRRPDPARGSTPP